MAIIKAFKAVRPSRDKVALVSSKSYEAYSPAELGAKLNFNPYSFLHVINPGYRHHQEVAGEQRFQLVHNRYLDFKKEQIFIQDNQEALYIYERSDQNQQFCGIIAATSVVDYENGIIKKHEGTISKREQLFETYLKITGFNAEPVLLMHQNDEKLQNIIDKKRQERPEYEFATTDKKLHKLWLINQPKKIAEIADIFAKMDALYIADGHHRTASSALLSKDLASENKKHTGTEPYNFFMSYLLPESDLHIAEFNRFVSDLNQLSVAAFLEEVDKSYVIEKCGQTFYSPTKKHQFSMYLQGDFYRLTLKENTYNFTDDLSKLDASILYKTILQPILGIKDERNDHRIAYHYSKKGVLALKTKVDQGFYTIGFGLLPVTIEELKNLANQQLKMPPKTTYIQPKLKSGMIMYEF